MLLILTLKIMNEIKQNLLKIYKNKTTNFIITIILIFSISYTFFYNVIFRQYDLDIISKLNIESEINKDIVVIEIDDKTLNSLSFPLERKYYADLLDNLNQKESKPRVIWFDILFMDKWINQSHDLLFARKIKESWNIVLPIDINAKVDIKPYSLFAKNTSSLAYVLPIVNKDNQKVYSVYPALKLKNWTYESLWFAMIRDYYKKENTPINTNIIDKNYKFLDNYNIPLSRNYYNWIWIDYFLNYNSVVKEFHINYNKPSSFNRISFYDVINNKFDKSFFKDKIVLVWYTAEWIKDDFILPWLWIQKWVYIHANIINMLLNNKWYIYHINPLLEIMISFILLFLILSYFYFIRKVKLALSITIFLWLIIGIIWLYLTIIKSFGINIIPNFFWENITIIVFSSIFWISFRYYLEDDNKKILAKALWEYVSKEISEEILSWKWNVNLSWENKKITIFFSDIAWFTTISEKLTPEKLVEFLRVYLWDMSDIIVNRRWFINKYEWDAIMALWWVFWEAHRFGIIDACESCLEQQKRIKELNAIWKEEWRDQIWARMWLHCWNAIVWNIGSAWKKMEFTALWDSVNLWSRLEWVNKFYWTYICASEVVYNEAKNDFVFRYLDIIRVKWKNLWVKIYELVWRIWEVWDLKMEQIKKFEIRVWLYSKKEFQKAIKIFEELVLLWDETSKIYLKRCNNFLTNPPPDNWDWIYTMEEK